MLAAAVATDEAVLAGRAHAIVGFGCAVAVFDRGSYHYSAVLHHFEAVLTRVLKSEMQFQSGRSVRRPKLRGCVLCGVL